MVVSAVPAASAAACLPPVLCSLAGRRALLLQGTAYAGRSGTRLPACLFDPCAVWICSDHRERRMYDAMVGAGTYVFRLNSELWADPFSGKTLSLAACLIAYWLAGWLPGWLSRHCMHKACMCFEWAC